MWWFEQSVALIMPASSESTNAAGWKFSMLKFQLRILALWQVACRSISAVCMKMWNVTGLSSNKTPSRLKQRQSGIEY